MSGAGLHVCVLCSVEGYEMGIERLKWMKAVKRMMATNRTEAYLNTGITMLRPNNNDRHDVSRGRAGHFVSLLASVHSWCTARPIRGWYNIHKLYNGSFHPYNPHYQIKTSVSFTYQMAAVCCCYVVTQVWRHRLGCGSITNTRAEYGEADGHLNVCSNTNLESIVRQLY